MAAKTTYKQCRLRRDTETGYTETTSWIPSKFAMVGWMLDLKEGPNWTEGWEVLSVSSEVLKEAPDIRKMIRSHRRATGDSNPRRSKKGS